eukprot:4089560-Karenia_brevis.AAC.1
MVMMMMTMMMVMVMDDANDSDDDDDNDLGFGDSVVRTHEVCWCTPKVGSQGRRRGLKSPNANVFNTQCYVMT